MAVRPKTASQKHAKLKELSKAVKQNIFEMLKLVDEILQDAEYVDKFGGEGPIIDQMEQEEFGHFGGQPSLDAMLRAYRHNPKRATWAEYGYNLRVMIDLATPEKERGETTRINWKSKCAELEQENDSLKATLGDYKAAAADLRKDVDRLVAENGELRGQIKELRRGQKREPAEV